MTTHLTLTAGGTYPGPVVGADCVIILVPVSIGVGELEVVVPTVEGTWDTQQCGLHNLVCVRVPSLCLAATVKFNYKPRSRWTHKVLCE